MYLPQRIICLNIISQISRIAYKIPKKIDFFFALPHAALHKHVNRTPQKHEMAKKSLFLDKRDEFWYTKENFSQLKEVPLLKAVITVLGCDRIGIIADITALLAENHINILDISQTIMQDIFTMIMLTDISESHKTVAEIESEMKKIGEKIGVTITVQHADIFHSMHRI